MQDGFSYLWGSREKSLTPRSLKGLSNQRHPFFWVTAIAVSIGLVVFAMTVHRFLAVSNPTGQGVLVVEAWIPSESLREAAHIFRGGSYRYLVVIGSQINASHNSTNHADLAADVLEREGTAGDKLVRIAMPYESANRTFATARAFKQWVLSSVPATCCVDVYTVGVHARKSWITFRSVLGPGYSVGVIAAPETSYNPKYWLLSRRGLWLVARNVSGYLYSKYEIRFRAAAE